MKPFGLPAVVDEVGGEPIEEFRVRGWGAKLAEVVGAFHDAFAEVVLPKAIDVDSCRRWIVLRGNPLGQHTAPATGPVSYTHLTLPTILRV